MDGTWLSWHSWSKCWANCGGGKQTRIRICKGPYYGGKKCRGKVENGDFETRSCNTHACPSKKNLIHTHKLEGLMIWHSLF